MRALSRFRRDCCRLAVVRSAVRPFRWPHRGQRRSRRSTYWLDELCAPIAGRSCFCLLVTGETRAVATYMNAGRWQRATVGLNGFRAVLQMAEIFSRRVRVYATLGFIIAACVFTNGAAADERTSASAAARESTGTPAAPPTADAPDPPGYRELVDEGLREYEVRNFEEARSLFTRAHGLFPCARTLRGIGMAEFELRNYPVSIGRLEAALASGVRPLDGALRTSTEQLLQRARSFVAEVLIETKPPVATVTVDDMPTPVTQGKPLMLVVGDHVIEVNATNHAPEKRRLSLKGGERETLTVVLRPLFAAPEQTTERRWYRSAWLWSAVGAAVAGGVATGVLLSRDQSAKEEAPFAGSIGSVQGP